VKPNWVVLLEHVLLAALIGGAMTWLSWALFRHPAAAVLGFIISLPVVAKLLAKPLIALGAEGFGWFARQPLKEWQGGFYMFDDQHVRIYSNDGGELWVVASDVLAATGLGKLPRSVLATIGRHHARIPGTRQEGLDAAGVRKLLMARREPDAGRFLNWYEREVLRPWERKRGAPLAEAAGK
jgi:hypothetical protein